MPGASRTTRGCRRRCSARWSTSSSCSAPCPDPPGPQWWVAVRAPPTALVTGTLSGLRWRDALVAGPVDDGDADGADEDGASDGAPLEGLAVDGAAVGGAPLEGPPVDGAAVDGAAVDGAAVVGAAVVGAAVAGVPLPDSNAPMSGAPPLHPRCSGEIRAHRSIELRRSGVDCRRTADEGEVGRIRVGRWVLGDGGAGTDSTVTVVGRSAVIRAGVTHIQIPSEADVARVEGSGRLQPVAGEHQVVGELDVGRIEGAELTAGAGDLPGPQILDRRCCSPHRRAAIRRSGSRGLRCPDRGCWR